MSEIYGHTEIDVEDIEPEIRTRGETAAGRSTVDCLLLVAERKTEYTEGDVE